MRALLAERGIAWPVVDGTPKLRELFGGIGKIPAVFVFDQGGRELAAYRRPERPPPTDDELRNHLSIQ